MISDFSVLDGLRSEIDGEERLLFVNIRIVRCEEVWHGCRLGCGLRAVAPDGCGPQMSCYSNVPSITFIIRAGIHSETT